MAEREKSNQQKERQESKVGDEAFQHYTRGAIETNKRQRGDEGRKKVNVRKTEKHVERKTDRKKKKRNRQRQ